MAVAVDEPLGVTDQVHKYGVDLCQIFSCSSSSSVISVLDLLGPVVVAVLTGHSLAPLHIFSPSPLKYYFYNTTSSNNGHGKGSHSVLQFDFLTELFDWQSVPWSSFARVEM